MSNAKFGRVGEVGEIIFAPDTLGDSLRAPTDEEYIAAGWYPVTFNAPEEVEGKVARFIRWTSAEGRISRVYEYADDNTPKYMVISKSAVERVVDEMGLTEQFFAWLNSRARYIGAWLRGGDEIIFDPTSNESDLASLIAALGIPADNIQALIESVTAEVR